MSWKESVMEVTAYYRVKKPQYAQWPSGSDRRRVVEITPDDVLMPALDGTWQKINGSVMSGLHLPPEEIERVEETRIIVATGEIK